MGNVLTKVKNWFIAHKPTKRRLIQVYAALLFNANIKGFFSGKIYTGDTKKVCAPGLNCYSCPGAVGACPLGALQDSLAQSGTTAPAYIFGILILFGLLLGRVICGFLCPFGLIQELLYKIRTPKLRKSRFTRIASYFKYLLLIIVIAIPIIYSGIPVFCKYICPAGTFEGAVSLLANVENSGFYAMLGYLFSWKFCLLVVIMVASVFIYRFLCRFICPLGAIYSLFCKISLLGVKLDKDKCINCGLCIQGCKMDIKHVGDHECIQCGECISICPVQAISWKGSQIFVRSTAPEDQPVLAEGEKINLLALAKSNATESLPVEAVTETAVTETPETVETVEESEEKVEQTEEPKEPAKSSKVKTFGAKVKASFKKPRFVAEFVAWTVAIAVLICALVFYNLPEKERDTAPAFTFSTYEGGTATENGYTLDLQSKRVKVLYFWRTDLPESLEGVELLNAYAAKTNINAEIVAVHSIYKDGRDVGKFINDSGWGDYEGVIFAQDDKETNAYAFFGGDISVPKPILAVVAPDGKIISVTEGAIDEEELNSNVQLAQYTVVYGVSDLCPQFTLGAYNGEEGKTISASECLGKVTVINFWYTTCDPCKEELPFFNKVYEELQSEINMIAVHSVNVPPKGVQNWLDDEKNKDGDGKAWNTYSLTFAQDSNEQNLYNALGGRTAYPMTVVVDADGTITSVIHGKCSEADLRAAIKQAQNK